MNNREERAELAIRRLRAMLEDEIEVADGTDINRAVDAAHALTGLDHAESVLQTGEDDLVLDHETARMVLARMHVVDELPACDAEYRSAADIADRCDRDEEYVVRVLESLAAWDVADIVEKGARLAHRQAVVEPLVDEE